MRPRVVAAEAPGWEDEKAEGEGGGCASLTNTSFATRSHAASSSCTAQNNHLLHQHPILAGNEEKITLMLGIREGGRPDIKIGKYWFISSIGDAKKTNC
jgi:hypothetical protein